ncbi:hypothetical protein COO60DRAFT_1518972 [Scenedesmus sp. NREL 46B-D3]|nr:hypothetical protein COO60DRAFT_1532950 [Scenedesmus sp. NREL 46B-D3]KAF6258361.1 hypothetical protein COO60DRAFT_1518972 [Scenedesmus sp. NREL 46B-D3]
MQSVNKHRMLLLLLLPLLLLPTTAEAQQQEPCGCWQSRAAGGRWNKKAKRAAAADLEAAATAQVPARNATKSGRKPKPSAKAAEQLESDELLEDEQSAESGSSSEEDDKGMTTSDDDSI